MPRAPKKCGNLTCEIRVIGKQYCDAHRPMNWEGIRARPNRGEGHAAWRTAVLKRDRGVCQIGEPGCTHRATEADHIIPIAFGGSPTDVANGQAACRNCHQKKTQRESLLGRMRRSN